MSAIEDRIEKLGLKLPEPPASIGNYLGSKKSGNLLFASARVSDLKGEVGTDVTIEQAHKAASETVLTILAIIKQDIKNLDLITGVIKMTGFIRSAPGFEHQPKVVDGASDIMIAIFGENGRHARTATGVAELPLGASVQLEIVFQLSE